MILALHDIARIRLRKQYLLGKPAKDPASVLTRLCAVQAQDYLGAKWALGQRCANSSDTLLDQLFDQGAILRSHVLRPTWHFVAPDDLRWLLMVSAPQVHAANAPYYRKLGLDEALLRRAGQVLSASLRGGAQLTRSELAAELASAGIVASGMRLAYLMMHAELEALVCSGALRGKQHTYALLSERVAEADPLPRKQALAALATRYFEGHGPALLKDFAWWSGLSMSDARAAVELAADGLRSQPLDDRLYWYVPPLSKTTPDRPLLQLLPNYDEYLIAYRDHGASFGAPLSVAGAALTAALSNHILIREGQVIGGWQRVLQKSSARLTVRLLTAITAAEQRALEQAAASYAGFLALPLTLSMS